MPRITADDLHAPMTPDNPTLLTDAFYARSDLHSLLSLGPLLVAVCNPTSLEVIGGELHLDLVSRKYSDVVHPHLPGDMGQHAVPIFQLDAEHGVGQRLEHRALHHDRVFLGLRQCDTPGRTEDWFGKFLLG